MKPAFRSDRAEADIQALEFYIAQAPHIAQGFVAALEKAATQIER